MIDGGTGVGRGVAVPGGEGETDGEAGAVEVAGGASVGAGSADGLTTALATGVAGGSFDIGGDWLLAAVQPTRTSPIARGRDHFGDIGITR